jgi:acetyl-CoA synthetase (ADP-forming)
MGEQELKVFLRPRSVAVIGASDTPGTWGSFIMEGLLAWKYPGKIYPVNRNGNSVYGIPSYRDIRDIPDTVDLAVVAVPQEVLGETLLGCASRGVKGVTIISAGFGEVDGEGQCREKQLRELACSLGMRLLGPNVSGTFNLHAGFNASGAPARHLVPSPLAAVCQGGYAFYDLLAAGGGRGMGVGWFVHTGNEGDLEVTDFLELLGRDPQVKGILMYLEALRDTRRFMEAAREVTSHKPVLVFKAGRTAGGARAARSHTGALSGEYRIYAGAFRQAGVLVCPSMDLLLSLGHVLVERPLMRGNRVGIMTMGGSWGVSLTDELERRGMVVPELSHGLQEVLRGLGMPPRASTKNPVDIGAAGISYHLSLDNVVSMAREMLCSGELDGLIFHGLGRPGMAREREADRARGVFLAVEVRLMREIQGLERETGRPVLLGCCLSPWESQAVCDLNAEGIRTYQRLDEMAWALALLAQRARDLGRGGH